MPYDLRNDRVCGESQVRGRSWDDLSRRKRRLEAHNLCKYHCSKNILGGLGADSPQKNKVRAERGPNSSARGRGVAVWFDVAQGA